MLLGAGVCGHLTMGGTAPTPQGFTRFIMRAVQAHRIAWLATRGQQCWAPHMCLVRSRGPVDVSPGIARRASLAQLCLVRMHACGRNKFKAPLAPFFITTPGCRTIRGCGGTMMAQARAAIRVVTVLPPPPPPPPPHATHSGEALFAEP